MSDTAELVQKRTELYTAIQMVTAGYTASIVFHALLDSVAMTIGFVSDDIQSADEIVDSLPADLKRTIRRNWQATREARAQRPAGVGHG